MTVRTLRQSGSLLKPPLSQITGAQSVRGPLIAATTITANDGTVIFDAGGATNGLLTQPLPVPAGFAQAIRIVAITTNTAIVRLTAPTDVILLTIGGGIVASIDLGNLQSGAAYKQVLLVATDDATWTMIEAMENVGAKIPSGPLSRRGTLLPDATYEATDVLEGVLYQNQGGSVKAIAMMPLSPAPITLPTISGVGAVGSVLTASPGTYQGTPTPTVSYQWTRDGSQLTDGTSISAGSQAQAYTVQAGDLGHVVAVQITATNSSGTIGPITSPPRPIFAEASGQPAVQLGLLSSTGVPINKGVALTGSLAVPADPASAPYARMPLANPVAAPATQVSETPGMRLYIHNWSQKTPVQPWLLNADGTLYGASQGVMDGSPPTFPTGTFTLGTPVVGFPTTPPTGQKWAGLVWIVGLGYVRYTGYNQSTGVFTGCDTRYSGTPAAGAKVLQVILPRVEPGQLNSAGGTSRGQLSMRTPGLPAFGDGTQATRLAIQPLTTVETAGCTVTTLAWMV